MNPTLTPFGDPNLMAPGLGQYGSARPSPRLQLPEVKLPTTAGDVNLTNGIFGAGAGMMDNLSGTGGSGALTLDQINLDSMNKWQGRNGLGKMFWNQDGSFDFGAVGSITEAIGGLGQLYLGFEANKTAKDSLNFQKQAYQSNLQNQTKSYNLALEDRVRARTVQKNGSQAEADQYINKHKL